jgi:predicted metal-dependent phosphoesterase TrpH
VGQKQNVALGQFPTVANRVSRRTYEIGLTEFDQLVDIGLDGIECVHSKITPQDSVGLIKYCNKTGILKSGGSDCHKIADLGPCAERLNIPDEWIEYYRRS